jgi:uncharacterized LabA/DUF88 family protein
MSGKFAILLDAGFVKRKLGSQASPTTAQQVVEFTQKIVNRPELQGCHLHRIYYYDAEPLAGTKPVPLTGPRGENELYDFSNTPLYHSNIALLDELKKQPYFAVRLGEVNFRGWLVKPQKLRPGGTQTNLNVEASDLIPNVQQKGVDMRIGLDIAALSLKEHVDVVVLVTGDSDFVPALKFARREGVQTFLYTLGHKVRPEVFAHTDICIEEGLESL